MDEIKRKDTQSLNFSPKIYQEEFLFLLNYFYQNDVLTLRCG